jgi:geranylgeranyl transferase type-2 subunit beta
MATAAAPKQAQKPTQPPIDLAKHVSYVLKLEEHINSSDVFYFTDHKRLSGVYWALSSLELLHSLGALPRQRILDYVLTCYHSSVSLVVPFSIPSSDAAGAPKEPARAAFAGNADQDPHLLYTLSGIQVLAMYDALNMIDADAVAEYIAGLQQPDGSFAGDVWGEVDSRFSYCALLTLAIIGRMDAVDVNRASDYVVSCVNFDGGFGCIPGAESHAGQVFCCVGALKLCGALGRINKELLGWWLCERQLECGGFNGRPDKKEDVCYSWWVLSSLAMLDKMAWIDGERLEGFIRECQDPDDGGIADRPGDMPDVFHTFFGLAGLALLGDKQLDAINPMYALPERIVARLPLLPHIVEKVALR